MKLTVINGCNRSSPLQKSVLDYLNDNKIGEEEAWINLSNVSHCTGCDYCQTVNPGLCAIDDGQNEVLRRYMDSDTVVILTPVQFGCCNSTVKNFLDRTEPLFLSFQILKNGKSIMKGRYEKYPKLVIIGVCDDGNKNAAGCFLKFINTAIYRLSALR